MGGKRSFEASVRAMTTNSQTHTLFASTSLSLLVCFVHAEEKLHFPHREKGTKPSSPFRRAYGRSNNIEGLTFRLGNRVTKPGLPLTVAVTRPPRLLTRLICRADGALCRLISRAHAHACGHFLPVRACAPCVRVHTVTASQTHTYTG